MDDEADIGDLLAYGLTGAGFEVELAPDGSSALRAAECRPPNIILLDVTLPDGDGFALVPKLRTLTNSPIIFVTSRAGSGDRQRGLSLGAADYVTKPFDMDNLISRVRSALA